MAHPLFDSSSDASARAEAKRVYDEAKREADEAYKTFREARDKARADGADLVNDKKAFDALNGLNLEAREAAEKSERALSLYEAEMDRAVAGKALGMTSDLSRVTQDFVKGLSGGRITGTSLKALDATSGASMIGSWYDEDLSELPQRDLLLLSRITSKPVDGVDKVDALRQTVATHNAAPVAAHGIKPTSIYSVERIEVPVRVVAHVSEAIDRSLLMDFDRLNDFVAGQLRLGVLLAIEEQLIAGDGTGNNFQGILSTPGIGSVVRDTTGGDTKADAIRKAVTALELVFQAPDTLAMHPQDFEDVELTKSTDESYVEIPGSDAATIWRVPVVRSPVLAQGTAILGAFNSTDNIRVWDREEARVTFAEQGLSDVAGEEMFLKNELRFRGEARIGAAVLRPSAFVELDLVGV